MGNYSATKSQKHKGNKNISILHSYLKKKNVLQEKVEQYYSITLVSWCLCGKIPWQLPIWSYNHNIKGLSKNGKRNRCCPHIL